MANYTGTLIPAISDPLSQDFNGNLDANNINISSQLAVYRGKVAGVYVYSVGAAPSDASDIIIVGYK